MYSFNLFAVLLCACLLHCLREAVALQCYSCPSHDTPDDCNITTTCQSHEVCLLRSENVTSAGTFTYHSRCEDKHRCQDFVRLAHTVYLQVLGRKRTVTQVQSTSGHCLVACCTSNMCNDGCHPPPKQACHGHGLELFENSCYMFVNHEMNFIQARDYCTKHHYHLVHINSEAENTFVVNKLRELNRGPTQYWIGITDALKENQWRFVNNADNATYFDWSVGEPDGTQSMDGISKADCAVFDPNLGFKWRDEACSAYQLSQPICESN